MKKVVIIILLYLFANDLFAQSSIFLWAKQMGGSSSERGKSITTDPYLNVYSTGQFTGTVDFDPGPGAYNLTSFSTNSGPILSNSDVFVSKLDVSGNFVWAKKIGGINSSASGSSIASDANGNVFITGTFNGTVDFDPGPGIFNLSSGTLFVVKLDASGNFVWAKGYSYENGNSITVDENGYVYITTGKGSVLYSNFHIIKLDNGGNLQWVKQITATNNANGNSIAVDPNGNVYITGFFDHTVDFDPGPGTYNLTAPVSPYSIDFICKLDAFGNFLWAQKLGNYISYGNSIAVDISGNVYTTGSFSGSISFGVSGNCVLNSYGANYYGSFISKLDTYGNCMWAKNFGGNNEKGNAITTDANRNVYSTGYFSGTVDFDPGNGIYNLTSTSGQNTYLSKLNASGNFSWAKNLGPVYTSTGNFLGVDAYGNAYLTGYFQNIVDFDPGSGIYNMTAFGGDDIFVTKYSGDPILLILPKIFTSKAILNVGQTQTITGKDFTTGGQVNLVIKNSSGDLIPVTSITYLPNGGFTYQLPITSTMLNGEYTVYATDNNSGQTSATSRFRVNNSLVQKLWVTSPSSVDGYFTGTEIQIRWGDFISNSNAIASSGFVQKRYKIERSNNGGSSWQTIASNKLFTQVPSNQIMEFSFSYSFPQAGTYIVKITDLDNTADNNTSIAFIVTAAGSQSFTPTLHWDNRISALSTSMPNPIGLAADGTSRIIITLTKNPANTKTVKEIYANISDPNGIITSGTDLLGKIMYTENITTEYNDEANNAFATSCDPLFTVPSPNPSFSFWLVSPDDFIQTANSLSSERVIKVTFTITYSDNTTSTIIANSIKIVRPPLLMIHGLNSSGEKAWKNAKFKIGSSTYKFKDLIDAGSVWKYGLMPDLLSYGSYLDNATILLGNSDRSFRSVLNSMQKKGFASCKVDYVCHSMGGAIARTAIRLANWYYLDKNYHKGYINKLITINTPHNGSYIADFFVKYFESISSSYTASAGYLLGKLDGFYDPNENKPSPAIFNLEAKTGGITFLQTNGVKNHLIASDIDAGNITSIDKIDLDNFGTALMLPMLNSADVPWKYYHNIPKYILDKFGNNEYFSNTDVVVPVSSQLPGKVPGVIDIIDANTISGTLPNSKIYSTLYQTPFIHTIDATTVSHTAITENLTVGSRVMFLLNSAISSSSFENTIPANTNTGGSAVYSPTTIADATDSVFSYIDTAHLKIASPGNNTNVYVDSTLNINVLISDTAGFKNVQLIFQGETYESSSKITNQTFNFNVHSNAIGKNTLVAKGLYDSLGYTIYHSDTILLKVISKDTLNGLYVTPKSQNLNRNHFFHPTYNAIYTTYIGTLNNNIDSLTFTIADTNVVKYIDSLKYFVTKDTGTTHIIFNYKGFIDSAFIYVGIPLNENITTTCSSGTLSFYAGTNDTSKTYQWQVDSTNGFENIISGIHYSGVDSCTLTLINGPSNWYNYRYRCLISDSIGSTSSQVFTLRFSVSWTGAVDTAWQNPANWSCGNLPDSNIDVIIPTGKPRYPQVNTNVACRSLDVQHGAAVLVKTGFRIDITGKNQ